MGITEWIAEIAVAIIGATSYPGIFLLMILESMVFPVPSEAVMPFAGFLIADGKLSFTGVVVASTLGSIVGSLISYAMGYYGGKPFINRFGKYLLLDTHDLEITERFFAKRGSLTIFIGRFVPVIRHLISIPAGIGKMNLIKFSIYTIVGAAMWNSFLTYLGIVLKNNWQSVMKYSHTIYIFVVIAFALVVLYYGYKIYSARKKNKNNQNEDPEKTIETSNSKILDNSKVNVITNLKFSKSEKIVWSTVIVAVFISLFSFHFVNYKNEIHIFTKESLSLKGTFISDNEIDAIIIKYNNADIIEKVNIQKDPFTKRLIEKGILTSFEK